MATLPTYTATIDNAFTETFFEIRAQAADNILNSNVVWALLKQKGVFKTQVGGTNIERTITYATGPTPTAVWKGDLLPSGENQTETAAFWRYARAYASHIQRDLMTDVENAGQFKIADYVQRRLGHCMEALRQNYNGALLRSHVTAETGKHPQGLGDVVPPPATRATGTWGGIARPTNYTSDVPDAGNTWWSPRYDELTDPIDVNLVTDLDHFMNTVTNQQSKPDIILTSQAVYEIYATFGLEAIQYVGNQKLMDLGFDSLKFKGSDFTYCPEMAASATLFDGTSAAYSGLTHAILFLNSSNLEFVYDPNMWFQMTNWKDIWNQTARIAHVLCRGTMISDEPRRHGLLYKS